MAEIIRTTVGVLIGPGLCFASPNYSVQMVIDAGDPRFHAVYPTTLTNAGEIGGRIRNSDSFAFDGFIWQDGQTTIIAQSPTGSSDVTGINSAGVAVGTVATEQAVLGLKAFVYQNGISDLYPVTTINPTGINDHGLIGGWTIGSASHAAIFDGENVTDLGDFGGSGAWGIAINNAGWVTVSASFPVAGQQFPIRRAFVWDGTAATALQSLGGMEDYPNALNDSGVIVGTADGHAVKWTNGAIGRLDELEGDNASLANSINAAGMAVGSSDISDGSRLRAALWDETGGVVDLSTLIPEDSGWDLWSATAINDLGQIAGYGRHNGDWAAFLLTPIPDVPEPSAGTIAMAALAATVTRRRRARPRSTSLSAASRTE